MNVRYYCGSRYAWFSGINCCTIRNFKLVNDVMMKGVQANGIMMKVVLAKMVQANMYC
jgi:hypothetical protein